MALVWSRLPASRDDALDVKIRPQPCDRFHRRRPLVDGHEIHADQRGERLGPQAFGKRRAVRAFVHEAVGRQRHHQGVAQPARRLEVFDVADVQQVENPVTMHDLLAVRAQRGQGLGQVVNV